MSKQKVVVHSILVEHPDLEKKFYPISMQMYYLFQIKTQIYFFEEIKDADGIIIADRKIKPKYINTLKHCKIIARQGIGVDNIDLATTKSKNIIVTNVPDYCLDEVSDYAMSLMLSMLRHIPYL